MMGLSIATAIERIKGRYYIAKFPVVLKDVDARAHLDKWCGVGELRAYRGGHELTPNAGGLVDGDLINEEDLETIVRRLWPEPEPKVLVAQHLAVMRERGYSKDELVTAELQGLLIEQADWVAAQSKDTGVAWSSGGSPAPASAKKAVIKCKSKLPRRPPRLSPIWDKKDGGWAEIDRWLFEDEGVPADGDGKQARLEKHIADWLEARGYDLAVSTIRAQVRGRIELAREKLNSPALPLSQTC